MTRQKVNQSNQQSKGETHEVSGVLQRAAVRAVAGKEGDATQEVESGGLSQSRFVHDFTQVPIGRGGLPIIQAKLMIGAAGDRYEQEADRVAKPVEDQISALTSTNKVIQRIPVVLFYRNGYVAHIETDNVDAESLQTQLHHPDLAEESKADIRKALMAREAAGINISLPEQEVSQSQTTQSFGVFGGGLLQQPVNYNNILKKTRLHVIAQLEIVLKYADSQSYIFQTATKLKEAVKNEAIYKIPYQTRDKVIAEVIHGRYINVYNIFFAETTSDQKRRENIVHETAHYALTIPDYSYMYNRIFNYLTEEEHQNNPDSIVRLLNNTLSINNNENAPGTGWESDDTTQLSAEQKARIVEVLDEAAAILGDVLYHLKNANSQPLQEWYTSNENYFLYIKACLSSLNTFHTMIRSKRLLLRYKSESGTPFEVPPNNSILIFNVKTAEHIDKANTLSQKVRWFIFQLSPTSPNITLTKKISAFLKEAFNKHRQGSDYHIQGKYPKILLDWSNEVEQ